MMTLSRAASPLLLSLAILITGCSSNPPVRYTGIDSATKLTANTGDNADRIPYRYAPQVDWQKYNSIIIDPVILYNGADNQFGDMAPAERQQLASYMQKKFAEELRPRFREVSAPAPGTLRLKLTLTGADTTTQVVGTVTKFDLAGGPYNIVQSIRGGQGMFSGSVNYAVEVYDAATNTLLHAYVAKQYPNAMNVSASVGSLSAAEVGIDKGAEELAGILK
ncbi:uncharacterized protein DUF3313 [Gibbsiella quercinecans]|uniref:DUF3313 domain-containing protein n=1 Tax=Gibbsiella quercinecans TaxID=929813 RepID=A0A250AZ29_9GAMM|nr:DUF3313 domain-containing protein [Gibbsiella quercinecans]ATA19199.1 hypothetical protein AWC35_07470 [Gibbsiella quercinecans]RLM06310.1 hypothetical protein BIY31_15540 [Gibbsiella quercinecans]RLM11020.1 hypothetical protein BIY30_08675 [Gibbsiella quercinecans]TCT87718.1 uncharacterized protein DUF3313 [Gibbsiella quercinecans]